MSNACRNSTCRVGPGRRRSAFLDDLPDQVGGLLDQLPAALGTALRGPLFALLIVAQIGPYDVIAAGRAHLFLKQLIEFFRQRVCLGSAHLIFPARPTVLQADGHDAPGERTANVAHTAHPTPEAGGRFEGEFVFVAQVFLHHAQDRLRSVESLRVDLFDDFLESGIVRHVIPPWQLVFVGRIYNTRSGIRSLCAMTPLVPPFPVE
jgi:hypothetical protein